MDPILAGALIELGKEAFQLHTRRKLAEVDAAGQLAAVEAATAAFKAKSSREAFEEGLAGGGSDTVKAEDDGA